MDSAILPNNAIGDALVTALVVETHEWVVVERHYLYEESMAKLHVTRVEEPPKESALAAVTD